MEADGRGGRGGRSFRGLWRPAALVGAVVLAILLARALGLGGMLGGLRDWIASLGAWGPAVFVLVYVAGVIAALPGSALTVAAGALFGSAWGVALVSVGSTVGAALAFLIARYFARGQVERWLAGNERFARLDELTKRRGAVMVALTRLVPLFPFNLLNYGFGLTSVPFWTYVFWSWLCMLPGTVLYVVGADAVVKGIAAGEAPWALIGVLAVAGVVVAALVRFARKRLGEKGPGGAG